jgi:ABC-type dipeptide/oligopeptide/nickel transport system ATPase component
MPTGSWLEAAKVAVSLTSPVAKITRSGCRFAARCPLVTDRCRIEEPELRIIGGARVACHLAGDNNEVAAHD